MDIMDKEHTSTGGMKQSLKVEDPQVSCTSKEVKEGRILFSDDQHQNGEDQVSSSTKLPDLSFQNKIVASTTSWNSTRDDKTNVLLSSAASASDVNEGSKTTTSSSLSDSAISGQTTNNTEKLQMGCTSSPIYSITMQHRHHNYKQQQQKHRGRHDGNKGRSQRHYKEEQSTSSNSSVVSAPSVHSNMIEKVAAQTASKRKHPSPSSKRAEEQSEKRFKNNDQAPMHGKRHEVAKDGKQLRGSKDQATVSDLSWSGISSSKDTSSAGTSQNSEENNNKSAEAYTAPEAKRSENRTGGSAVQELSNKTMSSKNSPDQLRGSNNMKKYHTDPSDPDHSAPTEQDFAFKDKMISYSQNKNCNEDQPSSSCSDEMDSHSLKSSEDEEGNKEKVRTRRGGEKDERPSKFQANEQSQLRWEEEDDDDRMPSSGESSGDFMLYASSKSGATSPSSSMCAVCPCLCGVGSRQEREAKARWMDLLKKRPSYQDEAAVKDWLFEVIHVAQNPNLKK